MEDDDVVFCADVYGVTHLVDSGGSQRLGICTLYTWHTGHGLMFGPPVAPAFPTCVYCIAYEQRRRYTDAVIKAHDLRFHE